MLLLFLNTGCLDEAGKNTQEEKAGNDVGGNSVFDLSLSPDGRFLLRGRIKYDESFSNSTLTIGVLNLENGNTVQKTLIENKDVGRMVFGKKEFAYLFTVASTKSYLEEFNLATGNITRSWEVLGVGNHPKMAINGSNSIVALWSSYKLMLINIGNDKISELRSEDPMVDVKWIPKVNEVAVVRGSGFMETKVTFYSEELEEIKDFDVPNCASSLEISPDGLTGMISPTDCNMDPVSIIDLKKREFVKNIPGFGPVAFAPDGSYAVAFARKDDLLEVAGIETETSYSIIFINTSTYEYGVLELGEDLPIYTITPDGELVLLYSNFGTEEYQGIFVIDVLEQEVRYSDSEYNNVPLDEFVMTPDSKSVFMLHYTKFYKLDLDTLNIKKIEIDCGDYYEESIMCKANEIMIKPDGSKIILGMISGDDFAIFDPVKMIVTEILGMK